MLAMNSPYARELTVAIGALQKASQLSQSIVSDKDKGAIEKDDLSPVTVADFAVQALLTATIKNAFPEDKVVGEEDASDLRQNSVLRERTYLLGQLYAINMALLVDGEQTVGIVGAPNLSIDAKAPLKNEDVDPTGNGCIFFAVKGHGAYIRPLRSDQPRKLPLHSTNDISLVTSTTVDSALSGIHEIVASCLNTPYPGNDLLPWVLRWAVLAMGIGNTTVWVYKRRDRYAKAWDHVGAMLLFEETGGKITDVHGKKIDLTAGRKMSANFGFVAARDGHERVLEVVREVLTEQGKEEFLK
ncbi:hypothetical protein FBEOM_12639 [Fusarium beomiforme]|uniref:Uncharacterized protein n=1 Tax=Fusarium beomiforme TaxID=44412 RepID=A0A9P5A793_9HYPO|nr:hypothetical protein FBEOM_12639 [Fusarium beomiforme]